MAAVPVPSRPGQVSLAITSPVAATSVQMPSAAARSVDPLTRPVFGEAPPVTRPEDDFFR